MKQITLPELGRYLNRSSYFTQRNHGCSHDFLIANGIGNEEVRKEYEAIKSAVTKASQSFTENIQQISEDGQLQKWEDNTEANAKQIK